MLPSATTQLRAPASTRRGMDSRDPRRLGMSGRELAARIGLSQPALSQLEHSEVTGRAQLDSMRRAAAALDCELVYALVPRTSLEEIVQTRAGSWPNGTGRLEIPTEGVDHYAARLADGGRLWDHRDPRDLLPFLTPRQVSGRSRETGCSSHGVRKTRRSGPSSSLPRRAHPAEVSGGFDFQGDVGDDRRARPAVAARLAGDAVRPRLDDPGLPARARRPQLPPRSRPSSTSKSWRAARLPRSLHFPGTRSSRRACSSSATTNRRKLVPAAIRGDTIWCIGMSEPNAGSDLAGLQHTPRCSELSKNLQQ